MIAQSANLGGLEATEQFEGTRWPGTEPDVTKSSCQSFVCDYGPEPGGSNHPRPGKCLALLEFVQLCRVLSLARGPHRVQTKYGNTAPVALKAYRQQHGQR